MEPYNIRHVKETWDSGLTVVRGTADFTVVIPREIEDLIVSLASELSTEFALYARASIAGTQVLLGEEYYIPEQEVTMSTVEFKEPPGEFNAVIHRHPEGCRGFSGIDVEHINSNFFLSLLYVGGREGRFERASLKLVYEGTLFLLESEKIVVQRPIVAVAGKEKIKRKEVRYVRGFTKDFLEHRFLDEPLYPPSFEDPPSLGGCGRK